jgi:site-specific DNA recombinase
LGQEYKVAYYVRVSREEQAKGYSLEGQKATLDAWSEEMGWRWVKTYKDEVSGKDVSRERFQEMLVDAKQRLFDGICMIDNDRFSRSVKDLLTVMDDLSQHGVKLHIYNLRHIDIYSDQGRFVLTNFAAFSEFFRGQLASKIKIGVKQKMKEEWFGRAPYGYRVVSDIAGNRRTNTRLVKDEDEQKTFRLMKKLRCEGRSYKEIADFLNDERIPTRLGKKGKKCRWHPITVRNILMRGGINYEKT